MIDLTIGHGEAKISGGIDSIARSDYEFINNVHSFGLYEGAKDHFKNGAGAITTSLR
jgi:hypothetical protein